MEKGRKASCRETDFAVEVKLESKAQEYLASPTHQVLEETDEQYAAKLLKFADETLSPLLAQRCGCEQETVAMGTAFPYTPPGDKKGFPCVPREFLLRTTLYAKEFSENLGPEMQQFVVKNVGIICAHVLDKHRNVSALQDIYRIAQVIVSFFKSRKCCGVKAARARAARAVARSVVSFERDSAIAEEGKIGLSTQRDQQKYLRHTGLVRSQSFPG